MPYVERVTKAGNTIEIERYFTSRYKKKGISRGDKVKPTKEEQEKVNTRQAERKLRILINANYGYGDYHLVLDYIRRKGEPDRTPEQMRQDIDVFLRECRKEYRKAGLEFKYIHVMEIGKKGARHHHLVVNKIDTEILQRCWYKAYEGHNRVKVFPLDDSGNYAELASYLIKYTGTHKKGTDGALQGKRWNCSKNLVRPEPEYRIISDREYFKKEPKAIKGYYVDKNSVSMGVHSPEYGAAAYLQPLAALIAGGNWNNGANCGARAVNCNNYPWNVNTNIGARGACDLVRTLQAQSSTEYWQGLRKG